MMPLERQSLRDNIRLPRRLPSTLKGEELAGLLAMLDRSRYGTSSRSGRLNAEKP